MMSLRTLLFPTLALLALSGCKLIGPSGYSEVSDLDEARSRWQQQGLDTYQFRMVRSCFCVGGGSMTVYVQGDSIAAIDQDENFWPNNPDWWQYIPTIEGLFDLVEQAAGEASSLEVTYDPAMGYPTEISIDWIAQAVDDEIAYSISDVRPWENGAVLSLAPGQTGRIGSDISLRFERLEEDSRCPLNAECIWAGRAVVSIVVNRGSLQGRLTLTTGAIRDGDSADGLVGTVQVRLLGVTPYPEDAGVPIKLEDYRALLMVHTD